MKKIILGLLAVLSLGACSNHGKKIKVDGTKGEVYYKGDGVTEEDAKKAGEFLKKEAYFNADKGSTVQVTKEENAYTLRFVYNKEVYDSLPEVENAFKMLAIKASKEIFGGAAVKIALASKSMKDYKTIPYDEALARSLDEPAPGPDDNNTDPSADNSSDTDDGPADNKPDSTDN